MIYTLKIYDTELVTFELTQKPLEGFCCQIISVKEENKHLLPLGMTVDGDGVLSWLKSRVIPQNREFVDKILNDIQKFVFNKYGLKSGEYSTYIEQVRQLFLPLSATLLEEYGIPFQITLKIENKVHLGDTPDDIISNLKNISVSDLALEPVEASILKGAISQL